METFDYVLDRISDEDSINFTYEFELTHKGISEIVQSLLEFNPFFRASAKEILKNPLFDSVRDPQFEKRAKRKIELKVD